MSFYADGANCQAYLGSAEIRPARFAKDPERDLLANEVEGDD
jgi:hypothetical protein